MSGMLEKTFQETFKVFSSAGKLALPGCSGSGRLQGGLACQIPQTMFPRHITSSPGRPSAFLGCHGVHLAAPQGGAVPNANPDLCQAGGQRGLQSICPTLWAGPPPLPRPQVLRTCLEEEDTHSAHRALTKHAHTLLPTQAPRNRKPGSSGGAGSVEPGGTSGISTPSPVPSGQSTHTCTHKQRHTPLREHTHVAATCSPTPLLLLSSQPPLLHDPLTALWWGSQETLEETGFHRAKQVGHT